MVRFDGPRARRPRTDEEAWLARRGERLHPPAWTEISAVCTAPEARGRRHAGRLVRALSALITTGTSARSCTSPKPTPTQPRSTPTASVKPSTTTSPTWDFPC
ncbi:GNAT family N-acetyltransferase [Amycolatopsis australiensis]|uniref:GNAT family N-acetyltransferase n=1 Tax=Amycolatopsis australiensis TaxID=546364 RepID=UPI001FE9C7B3|nr:GNAT family N-acetyltransferase [Amycolatopsis australiensis]